MKGLFILHSTNMIYGAAKSLSYITNHYEGDFDIIIPRDFLRDVTNARLQKFKEELRAFYGEKLGKVIMCWLPLYFCLPVDYCETIKWKIKYDITYFLGCICKAHTYRLIEAGQYDFIYLNSLILFPLLSEKYNMYLHNREVFDASKKIEQKVVAYLKKAKGIICIDYAVEKPLKAYLCDMNYIVLNNPFDMSEVERIDAKQQRCDMGIEQDTVVFTMSGLVSEVKGVDFVIQSFLEIEEDAVLLIVGNGNNDFLNQCKEMASKDKRVVFLGELKNMLPIYAISDYIVRGDIQFAIGRTVYEGLFSGTGVIMPGNEDDRKKIFYEKKYIHQIHFYKARDEESLKEVFSECAKNRIMKRTYFSNGEQYLEQIWKFIV